MKQFIICSIIISFSTIVIPSAQNSATPIIPGLPFLVQSAQASTKSVVQELSSLSAQELSFHPEERRTPPTLPPLILGSNISSAHPATTTEPITPVDSGEESRCEECCSATVLTIDKYCCECLPDNHCPECCTPYCAFCLCRMVPNCCCSPITLIRLILACA